MPNNSAAGAAQEAILEYQRQQEAAAGGEAFAVWQHMSYHQKGRNKGYALENRVQRVLASISCGLGMLDWRAVEIGASAYHAWGRWREA